MVRNILSVTISGFWITCSEFLRNEVLFKHYWVDHFHALGLTFATLPIHGVLWTLWSFGVAYLLSQLLKIYSSLRSVCTVWFAVFALMWIVIYNLQVLPIGLLLFAVPLSMLELGVATYIIKKLNINHT